MTTTYKALNKTYWSFSAMNLISPNILLTTHLPFKATKTSLPKTIILSITRIISLIISNPIFTIKFSKLKMFKSIIGRLSSYAESGTLNLELLNKIGEQRYLSIKANYKLKKIKLAQRIVHKYSQRMKIDSASSLT